MNKWELVIVWDTGSTDVYAYKTEAEATQGGENMKMAFGNQVAWWGTRKAR